MIIPSEDLSDIIGEIYDCMVDPETWGDVLGRLCDLTHFMGGVLAVNLLPAGTSLVSASVGYAPQWLARINDYADDSMRLWGGISRIKEYAFDEPIVCSDVTPRPNWQRNAFYTEWGRPQGLIDSVAIVLARDPTMVGNITFGRHETAGAVTQSDLGLLRLVAPHIRRAVTISQLLDRKSLAADTFVATLEALTVAVVLVSDDMSIVHANQQARALLADGKAIRSETGRLRLASAAATKTLRTAVSRAVQGEVQLGASGLGVPVGDPTSPSVAHVLPVQKRHTSSGWHHAIAAVFVARAAVPPRLPGDALAMLYDFTPAESRVFELIVEGQSRAQAAKRLGIAPSTVKTHLLRVFEKTGLHRQLDLVKLAASLSLHV